MVAIDHGNGMHTWYTFVIDLVLVPRAGNTGGEVRGLFGRNREMTAPHLHLRVLVLGSNPVNPYHFTKPAPR